MDSSNSRDRNTYLRSRSALVKRFVLTAFLLLTAWVPQAFAISGCEIFISPPSSATVAPSAPQTFAVLLQDTGGGPCAPANLTFSTISDTTGGVVLPATITGATFTPTGDLHSFSVTAGPTGGGTAVIQVNCSTCFGGTPSVQFTLNTTNVFVLSPTTSTNIITNQSTPFTLGTNLTVNGSPGFGYQTDFFKNPSGPSFGTPTNDAGGNASVTNTVFTASAFTVTATTVCPVSVIVPGCPGNSVNFNVTVEAVAMTAVSANAVGITAGGNTTTIARYGSTNTVVNPGYPVTWAITASPAGGDGSLSGATNTDGVGHTQATFTATVPGVYTVTASTGDTWSSDSTEAFTITVTAIVRTLVVSSGNGQSAPTSAPLPAPLVVLAQDNGVNAGGITINWLVTSGDATVTAPTSVTAAGTGLASMNVNLGPTPGPIVITATRADDGTAVATFNITSTLTRTLVIVSGNGQNATPGSPLANPLVVDAKNNGIGTNGVTINWTITPGSTLGTPSNVTAGGGLASNTVTVSNTPGVVTITATRQDDPAVFVTFTANGVTLAGIPGLKPNQQRLAGALDSICTNLNTLPSPTPEQQDFIDRCQELADNVASNVDDVIKALDELLPDTQAAQARASMLTASRQFENINARIAALRSGTQGSSFDGLALRGSNGTISLGSLINGLSEDTKSNEVGGDFQRWGFFASGTIGTGDSESAGVTPSFDFDIHGLTLGVDYRKDDKFIFGAAIGYTNQDTDLAPGQGGVDASGYTLSAYGTYFKSNSWYTDAVITFGKNNYDLVRQISYTIPDGIGGFTTVDQTARSDSGGDLFSVGATFGRDFQKGGWSIGPYGRVLYTRLNFDRIEETLIDSGPGAGLALIVEERSLDSLASILGGKFTRAISTNWGVLTPHFQLEWEHEFNSDPGAVTARFVNDPTGTEIILTDEPYDSDFFRIGLGLSAIMSKGRSGFLYYEKTLGREGVSQDNLALGFRLEF